MKVVLDSSVLIAAYISRAGVCADLLEDVLVEHEWIISDFIVDELARKLREKFQFPPADIADIRAFIAVAAQSVTPSTMSAQACRDPKDLPILGTAVAGSAQVLVTVDRDLLDLGSIGSIAIIKPGEFFAKSADSAAQPATTADEAGNKK